MNRNFYYVEVNKSFDENEHHDYSWYRGQPSVVWQGSILVGDKSDESEAKLIGHGHASGENGQIDPDVTTLNSNDCIVYWLNDLKFIVDCDMSMVREQVF